MGQNTSKKLERSNGELENGVGGSDVTDVSDENRAPKKSRKKRFSFLGRNKAKTKQTGNAPNMRYPSGKRNKHAALNTRSSIFDENEAPLTSYIQEDGISLSSVSSVGSGNVDFVRASKARGSSRRNKVRASKGKSKNKKSLKTVRDDVKKSKQSIQTNGNNHNGGLNHIGDKNDDVNVTSEDDVTHLNRHDDTDMLLMCNKNNNNVLNPNENDIELSSLPGHDVQPVVIEGNQHVCKENYNYLENGLTVETTSNRSIDEEPTWHNIQTRDVKPENKCDIENDSGINEIIGDETDSLKETRAIELPACLEEHATGVLLPKTCVQVSDVNDVYNVHTEFKCVNDNSNVSCEENHIKETNVETVELLESNKTQDAENSYVIPNSMQDNIRDELDVAANVDDSDNTQQTGVIITGEDMYDRDTNACSLNGNKTSLNVDKDNSESTEHIDEIENAGEIIDNVSGDTQYLDSSEHDNGSSEVFNEENVTSNASRIHVVQADSTQFNILFNDDMNLSNNQRSESPTVSDCRGSNDHAGNADEPVGSSETEVNDFDCTINNETGVTEYNDSVLSVVDVSTRDEVEEKQRDAYPVQSNYITDTFYVPNDGSTVETDEENTRTNGLVEITFDKCENGEFQKDSSCSTNGDDAITDTADKQIDGSVRNSTSENTAFDESTTHSSNSTYHGQGDTIDFVFNQDNLSENILVADENYLSKGTFIDDRKNTEDYAETENIPVEVESENMLEQCDNCGDESSHSNGNDLNTQGDIDKHENIDVSDNIESQNTMDFEINHKTQDTKDFTGEFVVHDERDFTDNCNAPDTRDYKDNLNHDNDDFTRNHDVPNTRDFEVNSEIQVSHDLTDNMDVHDKNASTETHDVAFTDNNIANNIVYLQELQNENDTRGNNHDECKMDEFSDIHIGISATDNNSVNTDKGDNKYHANNIHDLLEDNEYGHDKCIIINNEVYE